MSIDAYPPRGYLTSYEEGSFTVTATGFSGTAPSGIARYVRVGKQVVLDLPDLVGTSNASVFTILGLQAGISCSGLQRWVTVVQDNGIFEYGILQISSTAIDVFSTAGFGGWVTSGNKGVYIPPLSYLLP